MKAVIVGCGRVGAGIADELDRAGWQVVIIDLTSAAFDRLPATFGGLARRGDGTDEDTLRQAGAEGADLFLALTEGDNRNVMAAQLGVEALGVQRCVAKVNDPVRAEAYAHLGIGSLCRTNLMLATVFDYVGHTTTTAPGIYPPAQAHPHTPNDAAGPAAEDAAISTAGDVATPSPAAGGGSEPAGPGEPAAPGEPSAPPRDPSLDNASPEA